MKLGKRTAAKEPLNEQLKYTAEDLRWATPKIVADYRAQRLKCKAIADLGCGIGFQAFSFAQTCQKVYAVDIDQEKLKTARQNAHILKLNNIEFVQGNALDPEIIQKLSKVLTNEDIIFCDPQRPAEEEQRSWKSLSPDIQKLLAAYSQLTNKIAVEFPPQIQDIPFDCEKEYLSVNGNLNRLTLYFGELKQAERSAVILPGNHRLTSEQKTVLNKNAKKKSTKILSNLYEIDPAVVKAQLISPLSLKTNAGLYFEGKSTIFTSAKKIKSPFFKNSFKVLGETAFDLKRVNELLQKHAAQKVIIRYSIDPRDYWSERKKLESGLTGIKTVYLFRFKEQAVLAEKV